MDRDEHIKPDTTVDKLAALPPVFKENGVVTAGNASGINDGAAAVIVTTLRRARALGTAPLGRIVSWGVGGVDPDIMGIGPVPASRQALHRAGLGIQGLDLVEINEAFAAQYLAVERELGLDREKSNVNGGAVALGHPVGASGARLCLTLLQELGRRGGRFGLASLCIGGGQGIAMWWRRFMTSSMRTATAALLIVLLGAAAPAAAEELRQGLNAPLILQMLSRPPDKPETIMKEGLRRDSELSKVTRPSEGQVMPDGSVRYGTDSAGLSVMIKNPCPPGDIAHEMGAVPLPGRGRR